MAPSTGCTEPTAIALNAATARKEARGRLEHITVTLDPYLYKNAMCVGIPGADERGVALCAAMGATAATQTRFCACSRAFLRRPWTRPRRWWPPDG